MLSPLSTFEHFWALNILVPQNNDHISPTTLLIIKSVKLFFWYSEHKNVKCLRVLKSAEHFLTSKVLLLKSVQLFKELIF